MTTDPASEGTTLSLTLPLKMWINYAFQNNVRGERLTCLAPAVAMGILSISQSGSYKDDFEYMCKFRVRTTFINLINVHADTDWTKFASSDNR